MWRSLNLAVTSLHKIFYRLKITAANTDNMGILFVTLFAFAPAPKTAL
jgi:hypothetical protein